MAFKYRTVLFCLALAVVTVLVFLPGLSGRFLFDDYPNIVSNARIHATAFTWEAILKAARAYEHGAFGRPLATISFALNHVAGGTDPYGYKVINVAIHVLNALLVFFLTRMLLLLAGTREQWLGWAAAAVALVWAVHPIQVSSVLYVVQRMETLSLTFVLVALLAYLRGRRAQVDGQRGWPWLLACIPLVLLALASKETALLFPAYTLALELTLLKFEARSVAARRALVLAYAIGATAGALVFVFVVLPPYLDPAIFEFRGFTLAERLMTQLRVLAMYLGQILLPLPSSLKFYYDAFPVSHGLLHPSTLLSGLLLAALLASAMALRRSAPLMSLGILWFFAAHLLTSNVFPLELVFEHRNYFALLGVVLALSDLVRRMPMPDGPRLRVVTIGAIIIGFSLLTVLRAATWGNPLGLAMDLVAKNPSSARASNDLAEQYMIMADGNAQSPFYSMAVTEFERGSQLPDASPLTEQGLILLAATAGQTADPAWWTRLITKLRTRPLGPQEHGAVAGLVDHRYKGVAIDDRRLADAYTVLVERAELPPFVYAQFGDHAVKYLHDDALADRMFAAAVDHRDTDSSYATQLFAVLLASGHTRQAHLVEEHAKARGLHIGAPPATGDVGERTLSE